MIPGEDYHCVHFEFLFIAASTDHARALLRGAPMTVSLMKYLRLLLQLVND